MLDLGTLTAFVAATDLERARRFYGDVLGLQLVERDDFAAVFDINGATLRVAAVPEVVVAPYTVLGWVVTDLRASVHELSERGIVFERFEGMEQDEMGVWASPNGALVAWFKDPDGNLLSITQPPGDG